MREHAQALTDVLPAALSEEAITTLTGLAISYGLSVLSAVVILVVGIWAAGRAARATRRALGRIDGIDETLIRFLSGVVRYTIIVVTVLAVLSEFGVQTASLLAVLGAAGLAIGLALQGTLSNVAAGVMLLFLRPFRIGDFIEAAGVSGTVQDMSLFNIALSTGDNVQIFVPNSDVWTSAIRNFSYNPTRRVELVCGISYDDDIARALAVMEEVVGGDARVLADPEPVYAVKALGDSAVNVMARVWVDAGDYWPFTFEMNRKIKEAFDAAGLTIPYPTRTVYQISQPAPAR